MMSNIAKTFDILATNLNVLHHFDSLIKLFFDLYLAKFLDTPAKLFFSCSYRICIIFVSSRCRISKV